MNDSRYQFMETTMDGALLSMEFNSNNLVDLLEQFERFLRGCGFVPDGTLDFVEGP